MIKYWQSMDEYHYFLNEMKVLFDPSERARMHHELWIPWQKLRSFDTDRAMRFLEPRYSPTGRPAINQPQILRSFILFFLLIAQGLIPLSLTLWIRRLKADRVLAALIGCTTDSLPPLGSYYDFMDRLWDGPDSDLYGRNKLLPASWKSTKPQKPKGRKQKAPERRPKITEKLGKHLLEHKDIPLNYEASLQKLFYLVAVLPSLELGIIPSEGLTVSGDGTAVHTHANPNGHHQKDCSKMSPDEIRQAPRHYADPDASWGHDSDLEKSYYGYTLFHLSCHNSSLHVDVPLLLRFTSAARHDSVSFLVAFSEMEKHLPGIKPQNICLDSAMDNYPTYNLLKDRKISAFIDLNSGRGKPKSIPDSITIDKNGTPVCSAGLKMVPNGFDRSSNTMMWRCPYGRNHKCKCPQSCTESKYGRVIRTKPEWDVRLYTDVPRGTEAYKKIYNQRTATERINNRILNDYKLHSMMIHTRKHYSFFTTMIGICIHLDARYKQSENAAA